MESSYYSDEELKNLGLKSVGENVKISRWTRIYGASNISIGNNVRIDDFCVLSGKIEIENYVHIAVYCALFGGKAGIKLNDYSGLSSRCVIYAESDDYSGEFMTNPTVPKQYLGISSQFVELGKHVIIGSGSIVLPGVVVGDGCAVGSMSLVNKSLSEWGIYAGIPCSLKKERKKDLLQYEARLEG